MKDDVDIELLLREAAEKYRRSGLGLGFMSKEEFRQFRQAYLEKALASGLFVIHSRKWNPAEDGDPPLPADLEAIIAVARRPIPEDAAARLERMRKRGMIEGAIYAGLYLLFVFGVAVIIRVVA